MCDLPQNTSPDGQIIQIIQKSKPPVLVTPRYHHFGILQSWCIHGISEERSQRSCIPDLTGCVYPWEAKNM